MAEANGSRPCLFCEAPVEGPANKKYCSQLCKDRHRRLIKTGKRTEGKKSRYKLWTDGKRKQCGACSEIKNIEEFPWNKYHGKPQARCNDCQRELSRNRSKERRQAERAKRATKEGRRYMTADERAKNRWKNAKPTEAQIRAVCERNGRQAWRYWMKWKASDEWVEAYYSAADKKPWNNPRLTQGEAWTCRYANDPHFRASESGRHRLKKLKRKQQITASNDGTVTATVLDVPSCEYCGRTMRDGDKTIDHMDPLVLGGSHSAANIAVVCLPCNSSKGAKPFHLWAMGLPEQQKRRVIRLYEKRRGAPVHQIGLALAV